MGKKIPLIEKVLQSYPHYTKEEAFALILAGKVVCSGEVFRSSKQPVDQESTLSIRLKPYVSRGGMKLEKAIKDFELDCKDKVILDAGASTGGFTDCLLQHGAKKVFAVDVGFNQLDFKLRQDPRVVVMEKTNVKELSVLDPLPDFSVADLSFRSVIPILQRLIALTKESHLICLVKPQFELEPFEALDFLGVVKENALLEKILKRFFLSAQKQGVAIAGFTPSPILGAKGNREFLADLYLEGKEKSKKSLNELNQIVDEILQKS